MSALVSGALLQYGGKLLSGSFPNVTLTVGDADTVICLQATGPVPTTIRWYNPQGQLVSRGGGDEVNQAHAGGGRVAYLNFHSYQKSQGGKYECRVAGLGESLEKLPVLISQCQVCIFTSHKILNYYIQKLCKYIRHVW